MTTTRKLRFAQVKVCTEKVEDPGKTRAFSIQQESKEFYLYIVFQCIAATSNTCVDYMLRNQHKRIADLCLTRGSS